MRKIIISSAILLFVMIGNCFGASTGKITLRVIDEEGNPLAGAKAYISYSKPGIGGIGISDILKEGLTDNEGFFTAESTTINSVGLSAEKTGYYHSGIHYEFKSSSFLLNRWEPWNPTIEVVLKKKRNPVPMYQNYLEALLVPKLNTPVGFDLEKGDWVAPYGNGMTSDLVFTCNNNYVSFSEANTSCDISFSNVQDGLQEYKFDEKNQSHYKWPFEAPGNGYVIKSLNKWMSVKPGEQYKSNYQEKVNYLFRVRTVVDKNGNIVKANYGKMEGDFRVYKKGTVNFSYIFNPDGTRNLEEDPNKNLLKKK